MIMCTRQQSRAGSQESTRPPKHAACTHIGVISFATSASASAVSIAASCFVLPARAHRRPAASLATLARGRCTAQRQHRAPSAPHQGPEIRPEDSLARHPVYPFERPLLLWQPLCAPQDQQRRLSVWLRRQQWMRRPCADGRGLHQQHAPLHSAVPPWLRSGHLQGSYAAVQVPEAGAHHAQEPSGHGVLVVLGLASLGRCPA